MPLFKNHTKRKTQLCSSLDLLLGILHCKKLMGSQTYHIAMYPWFALGHITPFLHLSNKLAKKGHKISFFIPTKTKQKFEPLNLHPELITFFPITVPNVDGLPPEAETTSDIPFHLGSLLMTAMELTKNEIELLLIDLKVDVGFFDFAHWIPELTRRLGIKSVCYSVVTSITIGYKLSPQRQLGGNKLTETDLMQPPTGYPSSAITLHVHEARAFSAMRATKFGSEMLFFDLLFKSLSQCDAIAFWACREIEGPYCDYIEHQFRKPVLLTGPILSEPPAWPLEEKWAKWLDGFESGSVIYCAFGSECRLQKGQFQELLIGLELTGIPFLAALKAPFGAESVESALPEKFEERLRGKGVVHGGWVQQRLILEHPSVGCFITHCGTGSLLEGLVNNCQLVLLPHVSDQIINARMMSRNLKVGVEIEKGEEDGLFTRESVCKAVRTVMEASGEVAEEVRANHGKLRELLKNKDLESSYIDSFIENLHGFLI